MISDDDLLAAVREHGSNRKAAKALGIDSRGVDRRMKRLQFRGYAPDHDMTHTVPDGYIVKGASTLYRDDGSKVLQWVKSSVDAERRQAMMRESFEAAARDLKPLPPRKAAGTYLAALQASYVIGDPHVGMRAWAEECGADWDLAIAQDAHRVVVDDLAMRDRKSTRLNSSHSDRSRMPSSA